MTILWAVAAALFACLLFCIWRLYQYRREAMRLHSQIQSFLNGEISMPAFSVSDHHFAMFENAVIELETRLLSSHEIAREERAKSRAFVQDVSHQFKTPIAGLRLYCELDESAHREQKLQLVERMEALISALLKLERLRQGGYVFEYKMGSLRALALDAASQFAALYPGKRISVTGDANIRCDAHWMAEALANIMKNACEHTPENGRVQVLIEHKGGEAMVRVEDDGGGVPPEALPRLFERFYRSGQSGDARGVGLGLAIAKTITLKHHGSIRAQNGAHGLSVTLYLPILHGNLKES